MLWSLTDPPSWFPTAVLKDEGWVDPETGEILVAFDTPTEVTSQEQMGQVKIIHLRMKRRRMRGRYRIACPPCPIPYDTGINPNWY